MKKSLLILLFFGASLHVFSQASSRMSVSLLRKIKQAEATRSTDREVALFLRGDMNVIKSSVEQLGGTFKYSAGDISAIRIPVSKVKDLAEISAITWMEDNNLKLQPLLDSSIRHNHVLEIHSGFNLPEGYDGTGVVMGVIDEGIYAAHRDFRDPITNETRIKYVWDQHIVTLDTSVIPQPYNYGMEYIGSQIDTATMHSDGIYGHGTHVAGIACGNGSALNNYKGMAPNTDIIIVKMNLNVPDNDFLSSMVDAVKYIFDKADAMGKPAVINISLGTYFGSHDGRDIQSQAIANLISQTSGRVVCAAAGNAGPAAIHLGYEVTADTSFTWFDYVNQPIYFEMWGDSADFPGVQFSVGCDRVRPDFYYCGGLPFTNVTPYLNQDIVEPVYSGINQVGTVQHAAQFINGSYQVQFLIRPDSILNINGTDTSKYLWRLMTKGSGKFDAWSFTMVPSGLPDSSVFPFITKYKTPDTDQNIVSSFQCNEKVITVGNYNNRNSYSNANFTLTQDTLITVGELNLLSSHGPTRDGRIKPDIAAPGGWVLSAGPNFVINGLLSTEPQKVAAGGQHFRSSGTSMSSPAVAGLCALYLQRYPNANWEDVRNALINCATVDNFTGSSLPNSYWGHGKAHAYNMIRGCIIDVEERDLYQAELLAYPNPFEDYTTISYRFFTPQDLSEAELRITDMLGQAIERVPIHSKSGELRFQDRDLENGIYFYSLVLNGKLILTRKLVIL